MSKVQREAFVAGVLWGRIYPDDNSATDKVEADIRYPNLPLGNVREIVIAYLKDNGYDGLWNSMEGCNCKLNELEGNCWGMRNQCRPGVLVDGKIVERMEGKK